VPASQITRDLIQSHPQLNCSNLFTTPWVDVDIDGADKSDRNLQLTKGGGGALLQEKVLAASARKLVIIADWSKDVPQLFDPFSPVLTTVPVEVLPLASQRVIDAIKKLFPAAEVKLRSFEKMFSHLPLM